MTKYFKYTILLLLAIVYTGCEEDLLEQVNPNALTDGSFWQTEEDFEMATNALYSSLQLPAICGETFTKDMQRSDLLGTESWYDISFTQLKWNDATPYVEERWSQLYVGIFRANQILHYLESADFFTEEEKNTIAAQARFLRGYNYFWLAYGYNGAIIHDKMASSAQEMSKAFSSKEDVINTMVIPDMEFARENLPKQWTSTNDIGRYTWGAATAMLGKTYLYQKDWGNTKKYLGEIIAEAESTGLYALVPDFMDNFTVDNEFNSESVLEVAFSDNFKVGANGSNHDEADGSEATSIASQFTSIHAGGWNTCLPTYWCQELFVSADEMDTSNPINNGKERSQRTYATIAVEFADGEYYLAPLTPYTDENGVLHKSKANFNYGQSAKVKKWTQWDRVESEKTGTENRRTGINFRLIRYADILLMYAEAVLEESADVATAIKYIDQVRSRAGVIKLQSYMDLNGGQIPRLDISNFANERTAYQMVAANKENVLRHLRMVERVLELAFEGHRWYDLVRWGMVKNVFEKHWGEEQKLRELLCEPGGITIPSTTPKTYPLYLNERVRPDFEIPSNTYNSSYHDYLPVPSIEIQTNDLFDNE